MTNLIVFFSIILFALGDPIIDDVCKSLDENNLRSFESDNQAFKIRLQKVLCTKPVLRKESLLTIDKNRMLIMIRALISHWNIKSITLFGKGKELRAYSKFFWNEKSLLSIGFCNYLSNCKPLRSGTFLTSVNILLDDTFLNSSNTWKLANGRLENDIWLIQEQESTLAHMASWPLNIRSMVFTFAKNSLSDFAIKEVYKTNPKGAIISNVIGQWSQATGLLMTSKYIWERRRNLKGLELRIAVTPVN